jgi:hypothetical protein
MGKESQPFAVESLLVDTRRSAHKNLSRLGEFVSTKTVERFSKSASNSYVASSRTFVRLCDQSQSELRVLRNTKAIEAPKIFSSGLYPAVFRPLTLVPLKRGLGVPLANEINELKAHVQRVNCQ